MPTQEILDEIRLLNQFKLDSNAVGIKVHEHDAAPEMISAAQRLFDKGITDHVDGGYLTERGVHAAELVHELYGLLSDT